MKIEQAKDYEDLSRKAAQLIAAQVLLKPDCVLGLATGSTPLGTYRLLSERCAAGELDFAGVSSVNLDEYRGLSGDQDQSYRYFMDVNLFDHINIDRSRTFVPDGTESDSERACAAYDAVIDAAGRIDLQLLGIGGNGHIGFNEPSDRFVPLTHCVTLAKSTVRANARFFDREEDVPGRAYTMGIRPILSAGKVLLLASGSAKAQAVYDSFFGPVTPQVPASVLQLHRDLVVIADEEALAVCREKGVI